MAIKKIFLNSEITGTKRIFSETRLVLRQNAEICASQRIEDYIADDSIFKDTCGNEFGRSLVYARGAEKIEIVGEENCVLNGQGRKWKVSSDFYRRPSLIRFVDCKNVKIKNVTLLDSPCWAIHLHNCENVEIENVRIVSKWCANNDGIDLDCCRNVRVTGCALETGDDAIVLKSTKNLLSENITIEDCFVDTEGSGFKIGTESVGDFENITYRNNTIKRSNGCAIKLVPTDGASVKNVLIENIKAEYVTGPIFIANGERMRTYYVGETRGIYSRVENIVVRNMQANVYVRDDMPAAQGKGCIFISGTRQNPIKSVRIENCDFSMPGGEEIKEYNVPEMEAQYPEYYTLGTAPAYGAYLRNIHDITYKNVNIVLERKDAREKIVTENVFDAKIS